MDTAVIFEYLVGPAGIAVGSAIIFRAVWSFLTGQVWPVAVAWLQDQNKHMESLLASHQEDRELFKNTVMYQNECLIRISAKSEEIDRELKKVGAEVAEIRQNVSDVKSVQLHQIANKKKQQADLALL